jgi:hypothetical protein
VCSSSGDRPGSDQREAALPGAVGPPSSGESRNLGSGCSSTCKPRPGGYREELVKADSVMKCWEECLARKYCLNFTFRLARDPDGSHACVLVDEERDAQRTRAALDGLNKNTSRSNAQTTDANVSRKRSELGQGNTVLYMDRGLHHLEKKKNVLLSTSYLLLLASSKTVSLNSMENLREHQLSTVCLVSPF